MPLPLIWNHPQDPDVIGILGSTVSPPKCTVNGHGGRPLSEPLLAPHSPQTNSGYDSLSVCAHRLPSREASNRCLSWTLLAFEGGIKFLCLGVERGERARGARYTRCTRSLWHAVLQGDVRRLRQAPDECGAPKHSLLHLILPSALVSLVRKTGITRKGTLASFGVRPAMA